MRGDPFPNGDKSFVVKLESIIEHLKICRIDHWLKNIFIVFGHAMAVILVYEMQLTGDLIGKALLSLIPACFIASANYILNEILDAPFDRLHPTKRHRGVPAGKVKIPVLWAMKAGLIVLGFGLGWLWFENWLYLGALLLLLLSGLVYNVRPMRLKDRAFVDVIAESFNNPIRLWLGWFALMAAGDYQFPPLSLTLAWWAFGALLMTGKRYAEYRFIDDEKVSGMYRKSFETYTTQRLIIAMITYANLFCFCTGVALTAYPEMNNLILVFPMIIIAVIAYFSRAMSEVGARLEPEQLMRNPVIILCTAATVIVAVALLFAHQTGLLTGEQVLQWL